METQGSSSISIPYVGIDLNPEDLKDLEILLASKFKNGEHIL
jgi:hypothetical protein